VLVASTGHERESDRQQAERAGFDHHLTKPDFGKWERILLSAATKPA